VDSKSMKEEFCLVSSSWETLMLGSGAAEVIFYTVAF